MFYDSPMPLFSVITPCYNSEKWIARCIESVVIGNDDVDFEMIIINDGSTDHTLEICKEYAEKYKQLRLYSRENRGYCATMNELISLCTGDYVVSVDSDNWLSLGTLSELQRIIHKHGHLDFVQFATICHGKNGEKSPLYPHPADPICLDKRSELETFLRKGQVYLGSHGGKAIARRKFFGTSLFRGNPCGADTRLMHQIVWDSEKAYLAPEPVLNFTIREDSFTGRVTWSPEFLYEYIKTENQTLAFFENSFRRQLLPALELQDLFIYYVHLLIDLRYPAGQMLLLGRTIWANRRFVLSAGLKNRVKQYLYCKHPRVAQFIKRR